MKPVSFIGMGLSPRDLTETHLEMIHAADILVGGKRHLDAFSDTGALKKNITGNIGAVVEFIRRHMKDKTIVVLASGDPLFYGIGPVLIAAFGAENVMVYPNISSISGAFARIKESRHDAHVVSIHGDIREPELAKAFLSHDKIAVLTDPVKNPAWLAGFLIDHDLADFRMCVLEQLGTDTEQVAWYDPAQAVDEKFAQPNVVILKRTSTVPPVRRPIHIGMPDSWFVHQEGLITKSEVRAVTIAKLRLGSDHILWDLGAGSGSVSIEAAAFITRGNIFAVEQHPDRIEHIIQNKKRFGVDNLEIRQAVLPDGLEQLPHPDRIFIGGGGKVLEKIIETAAGYLKPDGVIVINTVLLSNIEAATAALRRLGFQTDITQIQISRSRSMPWGERLNAFNPVWIISGTNS